MPRPLHSLLFAVLTALLLVQPAVLAGASCAQEMLTGRCGCTQTEAAPKAHSCCAARADEGAPAEGTALKAGKPCGCTLAPVPHAPATTTHDGAGLSTERAQAWIDLGAWVSARSLLDGLCAPPCTPSDGSPPGESCCPHDLASRADAARYLTFLCTSLR